MLAFAYLLCASVHAAVDPIVAAIASPRLPADHREDGWRKPEAVLSFLEAAPGQRVLDYFAGPGYYSELLSSIVGPDGSVLIYNDALYAQASYHDLMVRLARQRLPNAKPISESSNYLRLPPASLDRVLFVMVYHDLYWQPHDSPGPLGDPPKVLAILFNALKPGGLVVVVDHVAQPTPREQLTTLANTLHRIDPQAVREDFERAGFAFVAQSDALRNPDDDHKSSVFSPSVRHRTDQFIYKFRRP